MKRLIDLPDELDKTIVEAAGKLGFAITTQIKQILWNWYETYKKPDNEEQ